jgi:hypothetical protein
MGLIGPVRPILFMIFLTAALFLAASAAPSLAQPSPSAPITRETVAAWLSREYGGTWDAEIWGRTSWAKGTIPATAKIAGPKEALVHATGFVERAAGPLFGLGAGALQIVSQGEADCQYAVTYRQVAGGVPVDGARLDLSFFKATGGQFSFTGTTFPGVSVATDPKVTPEEAARAAEADYREHWRSFTTTHTAYDQIPAGQRIAGTARLVIVPSPVPGGGSLAWKIVCGEATYRVDALTGGIIDSVPTPKE